MTTNAGAEALIIGGGVLGWSVAYRLARAGMPATVIDRGDAGYATQAGAGIIAPGSSFRSPEPFFPLAVAAMRYYPRLLAELAEDGAPDTAYRTVGSVLVARTADEADRLPAARAMIEARRDAGLGNIGEVTALRGSDARAFFPPLAEFPAALHLTGPARVDGRLLRQSLRVASMRRGVKEVTGSASLKIAGGRALVELDGGPVPSSAVVIAGGAWSPELAGQCGIPLPVAPQRGQIIHLSMPNTNTGNWPVIEGFHSQYLVCFEPDRVVCGATREHGSGFDVRMTAGGIHDVLTAALSVAPGLAAATIAEIRIGLRPLSPDLLPALGPAPEVSNLYFCTGHGASGLQLGPYSGNAVAELILGQTPEVDLTPYHVSRFAQE